MTTSPVVTSIPHPVRQRIPNLLRTHVFYCEEGKPILDALVDIVFGEHGMPSCTLVVVRNGGNGTIHKIQVPHKSMRQGSRAYYIIPGEAI